MKTSTEYRTILNTEDDYEYLKEYVYDEIRKGLSDVLDFIRCYEEEDYILVLEMVEVSEMWVNVTVGTNYKNYSEAVVMARQLVRTLVNSMFFNRSFEITSTAKTNIITNNIISYLSSFGEVE